MSKISHTWPEKVNFLDVWSPSPGLTASCGYTWYCNVNILEVPDPQTSIVSRKCRDFQGSACETDILCVTTGVIPLLFRRGARLKKHSQVATSDFKTWWRIFKKVSQNINLFICIIIRSVWQKWQEANRSRRSTNTHSHVHSTGGPTWRKAFCLHPGVGGAGELVCPVGRPPCGGVEVHIVGFGFESERLAGISIRGSRSEAGRLVLVVLLAVASWGRQIHSVAVVVLPVRFVVKWLCVLEEQHDDLQTNFLWHFVLKLYGIVKVAVELTARAKFNTKSPQCISTVFTKSVLFFVLFSFRYKLIMLRLLLATDANMIYED